MGGENSILQGCKLEEPLQTPSQNEWQIHPAKRKDGSRVSVFVHKKSEQEDKRLENAAKQLKILRHPTILKFFASCDNVEGTYLITEQVRPLELALESLSPEEICAGLYNIAEALSFLHERGGASHNNLCLSSVYISCQDGGWRLGGMEHLCKFEDATAQFLKASRPMRNSDAIPPEEQEDSQTSNSPEYGHARDVYAFGVLAQNMLEYMTDLDSMSEDFECRISVEFLHNNPMCRPKLSTLLNDKLFKNDFMDIIRFLSHLTLKPEAAKNAFFEGLAPRLHRLPRQLVANRLAPLLLSSFVMAEPTALSMVLPHFLTPQRETNIKTQQFLSGQINPLFTEDLFKEYIIPIIIRVFPSREMHVRSCLLEYFPSYVHLIESDLLKRGVLPQLLIGLKDSHNELVAASLVALAGAVPILGAGVVVGGERFKYFVEGRPKFMTNKESPLKMTEGTTNLTAVSGVITVPPLDRGSPAKETMTPSVEKVTTDEEKDVDREEALARRRTERELRREEMRLKIEQRRKAREARKEAEGGKLTLLSLTGKSPDSDPVEQGTDDQFEDIPPKNSPPVVTDEQEASDNLSHADKDGSDWSDWDDISQRGSTEREPNQSEASFHENNLNHDRTNEEISISKQPTKSLQLKNSAKTTKSISTISPKRPTTRSKVNNELGSEFTIPDIASPAATPEVDFFADMTPSLTFMSKTSSERKVVAPAVSPKLDQARMVNMSFRSTTVSVDSEEGEGWGIDDFTWNNTES